MSSKETFKNASNKCNGHVHMMLQKMHTLPQEKCNFLKVAFLLEKIVDHDHGLLTLTMLTQGKMGGREYNMYQKSNLQHTTHYHPLLSYRNLNNLLRDNAQAVFFFARISLSW